MLDTQVEMGGGRFSFRDAERGNFHPQSPTYSPCKKFNCTEIVNFGISLMICGAKERGSLGEHLGIFDRDTLSPLALLRIHGAHL